MPKAPAFQHDKIPVNLRTSFDMTSRTAQHMSVQDLGELIQLSFFEIVFPNITADATKEEIEAIETGGLMANCVAKINIPRSRYGDFVDVMKSVKLK